VVQRIAAVEIGAFLFNGLRFLVAVVVLVPFARWGRIGDEDFPPEKKIHRMKLSWILFVGMLLFGGAAFQQIGLRYTTAGNAGFITGLYVVWIPITMAFAWRQLPRPVIWVAAFLSAVGLYLLSTEGQMRWNKGDIFVLVSSVFWTFHVILVGRFVRSLGVVRLAIGQYMVCGIVSLTIGVMSELNTLPALVQNWWVVIFTGIISIGLGYTLQAIGQRQAQPADAAILLSMEAVFAALFGWWILDEKLASLQLVGCGVIFVGMFLAQSDKLTRSGYTEDKIPQ